MICESESRRFPTEAASAVKVNLDAKSSLDSVSTWIMSKEFSSSFLDHIAFSLKVTGEGGKLEMIWHVDITGTTFLGYVTPKLGQRTSKRKSERK